MDEMDHSRDDEISLLDLAVVIAESWKLLVFVPLLVGLLVYLVMNVTMPRSYESEAILRANAHDIALIGSTRVLYSPIRETSWLSEHGNNMTVARSQLIDAITTNQIDGTGIYRIRLAHNDGEKATQLLTLILAELIRQSEPVGHRRDMLELQLEAQRETLDMLRQGLGEADQHRPLIGGIGQSIVELTSSIEAKTIEIAATNQQLNGSITQSDIIQHPTEPENPRPRGLLMRVALAVVITGFIVLVGAFARAGFARASGTPDGAAKVNRIRRAFWLKPKPAATRENPAP